MTDEIKSGTKKDYCGAFLLKKKQKNVEVINKDETWGLRAKHHI